MYQKSKDIKAWINKDQGGVRGKDEKVGLEKFAYKIMHMF